MVKLIRIRLYIENGQEDSIIHMKSCSYIKLKIRLYIKFPLYVGNGQEDSKQIWVNFKLT